MESRGENALVCPQTGLIYPLLHGIPVTIPDIDLRHHCTYIDKLMSNDGVFCMDCPEPRIYPSIKKNISFLAGSWDLMRSQMLGVVKPAPRALTKRILRKLIGLPWRRNLEEVQRCYENWNLDLVY